MDQLYFLNDCMLVYMRKTKKEEETMVVVANFANVQRNLPLVFRMPENIRNC